MVLSHHNAGLTQVSHAVVASSAIPLALPKRRLVMAGGHKEWAVRRVFDGGAWANYPRFVFADSSFREFSRLPAIDPQVRTVGFALHIARDSPAVLNRPGIFVDASVLGPSISPSKRPWRRNVAAFGLGLALAGILQVIFSGHPLFTWQIGAVSFALSAVLLGIGRSECASAFREWMAIFLNNRVTRLGLFLATAVCFGLAPLALHDLRDVFGPQALGEDESGGILTFLGFVLLFTLPTALLLMFGSFALILRFQSFLLEDAAPVLAASLGSATKLPAWAGRGPGDHLVRVPVNPPIDTTDFDIHSEIREEVICNARQSTADRVARVLAAKPEDPSDPVDEANLGQWRPAPDDLHPPPPPDQFTTGETLMLVGGGVMVVFGILLGEAFRTNADAGLNPAWYATASYGTAVVGGVAIVLAFWRRRRGRRSRRAPE